MIKLRYGSWSTKTPASYIKNLPAIEAQTFDLMSVFSSYHDHGPSVIDDRSFYCSDVEFNDYINDFYKVGQDAPMLLFEHIFENKPSHLNWHDFGKKLLERTKIIFDYMQKPNLVAPPIINLKDDAKDVYLEYIAAARNYINYWGMHCITEMNEQIITNYVDILNQCLTISKKQLYVTKFLIPSCEHEVSNKHINWKPNTHIQSANQMKNFYKTIQDICKYNSIWYFVADEIDYFDPKKKIPDNFYNINWIHPVDSTHWNSSHFLGSTDYKGNTKTVIFDTIKELHGNV